MNRTIFWEPSSASVKMVDQQKLPGDYTYYTAHNTEDLVESIKKMRVRGAPALGAAGALGVALTAKNTEARDSTRLLREVKNRAQKISNARPTAVNLEHGVKKVLAVLDEEMSVPQVKSRALEKARELTEQDVEINREIGARGARLLEDGQTVMTHCNAGALATVGHGTALGVVYSAVESGKRIDVIVNETRPQNQGARITTVELEKRGLDYRLIPDNASGLCFQRNEVDAVVVGADRIVLAGGERFGSQAVAFNKIGTYKHAVLAARHEVPFVVAAPVSTVDAKRSAAEVEIEERPAEELRQIYGCQNAPEDAPVYNPAFDPTPAELIDYFVTERGVFEPPLAENESFSGGEDK